MTKSILECDQITHARVIEIEKRKVLPSIFVVGATNMTFTYHFYGIYCFHYEIDLIVLFLELHLLDRIPTMTRINGIWTE